MWEERISRATNPAILLEHSLRYRVAMPIVDRSALWVDLGAGGGVAAAHAIDGPLDKELLLVDIEPTALAAARDELLPHATRVDARVCDLSDARALQPLAAELVEQARGRDTCITCFEVVEHLEDFGPLLELLRELVDKQNFTVVLSVPNDSFWGVENPHHQAMWGGRAFEEFLRLLPEPRRVAYQVPLVGSAIVTSDQRGNGTASSFELPVAVSTEGVPSHYLVGFGKHLAQLERAALVAQSDLDQQRGWERQREADLAYLRKAEQDLVWMLNQRDRPPNDPPADTDAEDR